MSRNCKNCLNYLFCPTSSQYDIMMKETNKSNKYNIWKLEPDNFLGIFVQYLSETINWLLKWLHIIFLFAD